MDGRARYQPERPMIARTINATMAAVTLPCLDFRGGVARDAGSGSASVMGLATGASVLCVDGWSVVTSLLPHLIEPWYARSFPAPM